MVKLNVGLKFSRWSVSKLNHSSAFFAVMHDLQLIHTDLKPENILLVSSEYVKVPDYKVLICKTYFVNL